MTRCTRPDRPRHRPWQLHADIPLLPSAPHRHLLAPDLPFPDAPQALSRHAPHVSLHDQHHQHQHLHLHRGHHHQCRRHQFAHLRLQAHRARPLRMPAAFTRTTSDIRTTAVMHHHPVVLCHPPPLWLPPTAPPCHLPPASPHRVTPLPPTHLCCPAPTRLTQRDPHHHHLHRPPPLIVHGTRPAPCLQKLQRHWKLTRASYMVG